MANALDRLTTSQLRNLCRDRGFHNLAKLMNRVELLSKMKTAFGAARYARCKTTGGAMTVCSAAMHCACYANGGFCCNCGEGDVG